MTLPQSESKCALCTIAAALALLVFCSATAAASNLVVSPSNLQFGDVLVGQNKTLWTLITNKGTASVTVSRVHSRQSNYTLYASLPRTLAPGQSVGLAVTFTPTTAQTTSGTVSVNYGTAYLNVAGSGLWKRSSPSVSASPSSLSFGSVKDGSAAALSVTLTNKGSSHATISQASTSSGFAAQGLTLPLTLSGGQSFTFKIAFDPTASGSLSGTFKALNSSGSTLVSIPLSGTGTAQGQLSLSPSSASFGSVTVGSASSKSGTLSATGSSVTVTSAGSSSAEFVLSGITLPMTISAGSSASYSVTFKPQSSGAASATVSFASNASDSSLSESLTGTGVATTPPPTYSVDLNWTASTSQVSGYNIYRGSTSGGPYTKLNSSLNSGTSYIDGSVTASATYYYVTTAVNSSGQESTYSNQVQVAIP